MSRPPSPVIDRLAARVVARPEALVLIDALPGTGRSCLARAIAVRLGTAPRSAPPPPATAGQVVAELPPGARATPDRWPGRAVLVAKPGQVDGLARARVHGRLLRVGNGDLFLPPEAAPAFEESAGWPVLEAHYRRAPGDRAGAVAWLREVVLAQLDEIHYDLVLALDRAGSLAPGSLTMVEREALDWLAPLAAPGPEGVSFRTAAMAGLLRAALADRTAPPRSVALMERGGRPEAAIAAAAEAGHRRAALELLSRSGGMMLGHLRGPAAAHRVLEALAEDPDPEVTGLAVQGALKAGRTERARLLLEAAQPSSPELARALAADGDLPEPLKLCHLLLVTYQEAPLPQAAQAQVPALLARMPGTAHLRRGLVWNIMTDAHLRAGRFDEAEQAAARALTHFETGGAPYLAFYIHLYLCLIRLRQGMPGAAVAPLAAAGAALAATPFDTPHDARVLDLLRALVSYERGDPEPMATFAERAFENFAYGEIWPAIAGHAMAAGAEALAQVRGAKPALTYLGGWRVQAVRTRHFRLTVAQREVAVLQGALRWREARQALEAMATRIGRLWMESSAGTLADLSAPEDIQQAMLWLRLQAFDRPKAPGLSARLAALASNPRLNWRDRAAVSVWRAWIARRLGRVSEAVALLDTVLRDCAARDCRAPALEERLFIRPLLEDPRMAAADPLCRAPVPEALWHGTARAYGGGALSRQEWRALLLLAEGCSNKEIAREMAVSVPTVKFHLKNLFAKLGVGDRRAAVAMAQESGMIAA